MSVEWAFSIDDSEAIGASERLEHSLTGLNATASGIDSRLAQVSAAELDAAISAGRFASAVNELELSMVGDDTGKLTVKQLELVKSMRMAESEAKQAQAALSALSADEGQVAANAKRLDRELSGMSQAELRAAQAATRLSAAHEKYETSLASVARGTGKLGAEQYELADALGAARRDMASAQHDLDRYNKSVAESGSKSKMLKGALAELGTVAKSGALAVAALGAAAVVAGGHLAVEVFHAQDFARTTVNSFAAMTGSVEEGEQALASIRDVAKATGAPLEEVRKTFGTLRAAGIGDQMSADLSKMRMDWLAMGEEGESAFGKLTDAMVEGVATASMFEDLTKNLAGMGVSSRTDFGKALGLSDAALQRTADGAALLDQELAALDPRKLLEVAVATSKANGELGAVSLSAKSFGERIDSFKETSLQTFVQEMGLSGDAIDGLLAKATELVESDDFASFARSTGDALVGLGNIAIDVAGWIVDNWDTIGPILKGIGIAAGVVIGVLGVGAATLGFMFSVVPALGVAAVAAFVALYDGVKGKIDEVVGVFQSNFDSLTGMITSFGETMIGLGAGVVDGLITGIQSKIGSALETVRNLGSQVSATFKSTLGIASPSKVFRSHGGNVVGGLTKQMEADTPKASDSAYGLAEAVQSGFVPPDLAMSMSANDNASDTLKGLKASAAEGISGVSVPLSYDVAKPSALEQSNVSYLDSRRAPEPSYMAAPQVGDVSSPQVPEPQVTVTAADASSSNKPATQHNMTVGSGAVQIIVQGAGDMTPQDIQRAVEAALEQLARKSAA